MSLMVGKRVTEGYYPGHYFLMTPRQRCAWLLQGALTKIAMGETPDLVSRDPSLDALPDMTAVRESRLVLHKNHYYMRANGTLFRQSANDALTKDWDEVIVPKPEEPTMKEK